MTRRGRLEPDQTATVGPEEVDTLISQMEQSLRSRTVIDQSLGIIMRDQRCTATTAFELLRRESQNNHRRLYDIAADLITTTTGHAPEEGRAFDKT